MQEWGRDRAGDLVALVDLAMPGERLGEDELVACCWDDPGVVLGAEDGSGVAAAVVRSFVGRRIGYLELVAVHPEAGRAGVGRALVDAAERWMFDQGVTEVQIGGAAPFYLWPGVDTRMTAMLCLAEAAGYEVTGAEINMALPTTFRAEPPPGTSTRRALEDADTAAVSGFVQRNWPWWLDETRRSIEHGTCHAAFSESDEVVGFACHSVNRPGWIGPMGTDPTHGFRGIGHGLLGEVASDLMVSGLAHGEIAWVGPVRFYAKAGAEVSRVFRTFRKVKS